MSVNWPVDSDGRWMSDGTFDDDGASRLLLLLLLVVVVVVLVM